MLYGVEKSDVIDYVIDVVFFLIIVVVIVVIDNQ